MNLPENNLAHRPGPDDPMELDPVFRWDMDHSELDERVDDAVMWMRWAVERLPEKKDRMRLLTAIEEFEEEGW